MQRGYKPSAHTNIQFSSREKALALILESVGNLGWKLVYFGLNAVRVLSKSSNDTGKEEITILFDGNYADITSRSMEIQLWDWGRNQRNIRELIRQLRKLNDELSEYEIFCKYLDLQYQIEANPIETVEHDPPAYQSFFQVFLSLFMPRQSYYFTPVAVDLNILMYVIMLLSGVDWLNPEGQSLIGFGANFKPLTLNGEWWRLFSCFFLHANVFHLIVNMYVLIIIGAILEPRIGSARFTFIYCLAGWSGSMLSLWWNDNLICVGASGAILGLYGSFAVLLGIRVLEKKIQRELIISVSLFLVYNLINGLQQGIDNAAHIGGIAGGMLTTLAFSPSLKRKRNLLLPLSTSLAMLTIFTAISIYLLETLDIKPLIKEETVNNESQAQEENTSYLSNDPTRERFYILESLATEVYNKIDTESRKDVIQEIKTRSLYYYQQNIDELQKADTAGITVISDEKIHKRIHYCELRIKSLTLLCKSLQENTHKYDKMLTDLDAHIKEAKKFID